jgi:uncharacterized membrane protein
MTARAKTLIIFFGFLTGTMLTGGRAAGQTHGVTLYTPYTKISVPPGESIDYAIDVINNGGGVKTADIALAGFPRGWNYDLKSGGWAIGQISVLPNERKNFNLRVEVPLKVDKGTYSFRVVGNGFDPLPLTVIVSKQGTFKTEFTIKQPNMEGHANATFTFNADLKNRTGEKQLYALRAGSPPGWNISFKASYKQVTSVSIEPNQTESITIDIDPPDEIEAGTYKIPVSAVTATTSADLELEVVIKGSYKIELTTPQGLLSTNITAGDQKRVELVVKNIGSAEMKDIKLEFSAPINWDVIFDPKKIDKLEPGKTAQVFATIKADKKAIAGDYVSNLEAKTAEASSKVSFRVSVETPLIWGWVGIMIIVGVVGGVYYLFRKYGRR